MIGLMHEHAHPTIHDVTFGFPQLHVKLDIPRDIPSGKYYKGVDVLPDIRRDRAAAEPELKWRVLPTADSPEKAARPTRPIVEGVGQMALTHALTHEPEGEVSTAMLERILDKLRESLAHQPLRHTPTKLPPVDAFTGATGEYDMAWLAHTVNGAVGEQLAEAPVSSVPFSWFTDSGAHKLIDGELTAQH